MTITPHDEEGTDVEQTAGSPATMKHRFSFIGIMDAEPNLAERSAGPRLLFGEVGKRAVLIAPGQVVCGEAFEGR